MSFVREFVIFVASITAIILIGGYLECVFFTDENVEKREVARMARRSRKGKTVWTETQKKTRSIGKYCVAVKRVVTK